MNGRSAFSSEFYRPNPVRLYRTDFKLQDEASPKENLNEPKVTHFWRYTDISRFEITILESHPNRIPYVLLRSSLHRTSSQSPVNPLPNEELQRFV